MQHWCQLHPIDKKITTCLVLAGRGLMVLESQQCLKYALLHITDIQKTLRKGSII